MEENSIHTAIGAGMALAEPHAVVAGHLLTVVVPEGAKLEKLDIESYQNRPTRKRGTYNFEDAKSFIAFVNREKTPETIILATREVPGFTAIFNGNLPQNIGEQSTGDDVSPGWGDYKAVYACPMSAEWKAWFGANGRKMSQAEFAVFVEDNALDIVQPPVGGGVAAADTTFPDSPQMVEIARSLSAKNNVTFASAIRLSNGEVQFKYEEEISGTVQGGTMEVPQRFAIGVPVFAGTDPWVIVCKLRYRIERGGLVMWFDMERVHKVLERSFDEARTQIDAGTSVPVFLGRKA